MIVVAHIGVFRDASETSYVYIQIKQLDVVTTFLDMMKFGLLIFLVFILSIISSINTEKLFRRSIWNNEGTIEKLRQKPSQSKSLTNVLISGQDLVTVADNLLRVFFFTVYESSEFRSCLR